MTRQAKVLETVKKLLSLTEARGATEAEAQAAVSQAQRLLAEVNLTISDVDAELGPMVWHAHTKSSRTPEWLLTLLDGVAKGNFCIACKVQELGVLFAGRQANVASAVVMADYLCEVVQRLTQKHIGDKSKDPLQWEEPTLTLSFGSIMNAATACKGNGASNRQKSKAFRIGLANGLSQRLIALGGMEASLACMRRDEAEEWVTSGGATMEPEKPKKTTLDGESFNAGLAKADEVNLLKQVDGAQQADRRSLPEASCETSLDTQTPKA